MAKTDKKKDTKPAESVKQNANMPLFYTSPQPLDKEKHVKLALKENFKLDFAKKVNAVPINLIEMPQVCHHFPIAFSPDENATPVAILGLRDNENLFVNDKGEWEQGAYIPAYIRRYPFIFSELPKSDQLTLCVDINDDVVSEKGKNRFFDDKSEPTDLAKNALEFCKSYHAAAQQTFEFSKELGKSGLLIDRQAEIEVGGGKKISFSGFRILDESKLAQLDDKQFMEWRKKGWLPFLYAHLFSGSQWQSLVRKLNAAEKSAPKAKSAKK